ncbi:MAG: DMT family transporter [Acidobacteriota bacterium]|nr:DMT family transporter [Acidobacteriota bacterium]
MSGPTGDRVRILGAALLFSTGGAIIKLTTLSGWQVACYRSGLAALALYVCVPGWRRGWRLDQFVVGTAYAATMILFVCANKLTTAANTIFLQSTAPIYLLFLGPLALRERIGRGSLIHAGMLAVGLGLFFLGNEAPQVTAPRPLLGNILGAIAGITWALAIVGLRRLSVAGSGSTESGSGAAVIVGNGLAFLFCLPFAAGGPAPSGLDLTIVLYLGFFQIGLAYVWMTRGLRGVPALEASLLLILEPVASALWAWWIHGERPGDLALAGCLLILVATVLHTVRKR